MFVVIRLLYGSGPWSSHISSLGSVRRWGSHPPCGCDFGVWGMGVTWAPVVSAANKRPFCVTAPSKLNSTPPSVNRPFLGSFACKFLVFPFIFPGAHNHRNIFTASYSSQQGIAGHRSAEAERALPRPSYRRLECVQGLS